jgi:Holliday junction resolvase
MHTDDELIECKTVLPGKKQITIKLDDVKSLHYHAAIKNKRPVLHIELDKYRLVLIPEADYEELRDLSHGGHDEAVEEGAALDDECGAQM